MRDEHIGGVELKHFSSDGVDIAFIDAEPQGRDLNEPILLIHGFASNHRMNWVDPRWVETLTGAGRRVIAFDNRGHGQSEKLHAPADYHLDLMTRDAANLLAHLGVERADVMGYSMGARIASFLALSRAEPGALARARRPRRSAGARRGIARDDRRSLGSAIARQPCRSDAAPVPRLRRADEERPRRARRLRPWFAQEPDAGRGGAHKSADFGRGRRAGYACGRPLEARRPVAARARRLSFPAAITISRSATRRSRPGRLIFSPAGRERSAALRHRLKS